MAILSALLILALAMTAPAAENGARCDRLRAEFAELAKNFPKACLEAMETHNLFLKSNPEIQAECIRLETKVSNGPPRLKQGTEDEMRLESMAIRQKNIEDRQTITDRVARDLLWIPTDSTSPSRPPAQVSSQCGTELELYVSVRSRVLSIFSIFLSRLEQMDDGLFQQAAERGTSTTAVPQKSGR